jgi:hypothetical protein
MWVIICSDFEERDYSPNICLVKVKVKLTLEQATKFHRGSRGIAVLFLNLGAILMVGGQRHAPAAGPPGRPQYPLYRRLCGPQGRSGWVQQISPPPGFDSMTVQPVASSYTNWAVVAQPFAWSDWKKHMGR